MRIFVGLCSISALFFEKIDAMVQNNMLPTETIVIKKIEIRKGDFFQELNRSMENNDNATVKLLVKIARNSRFRGWNKEFKARLLFYAVENEWEEIVEDCADNRFDLNIKNKQGETPLLIATSKGNITMVDYLLKAGANPNISDYRTKLSPLMIASREGNEDLVMLLIRYNAEVNAISRLGCSPLSLAVGKNYHNIVQILMNAGANVHLVNQNGHTPLSMALYCHHVLDKKPQEKAKSDITVRMLNGHTPLSMALYCHHVLDKKPQEEAKSDITVWMPRKVKPLSWISFLSSIRSHVLSIFRRNKVE